MEKVAKHKISARERFKMIYNLSLIRKSKQFSTNFIYKGKGLIKIKYFDSH